MKYIITLVLVLALSGCEVLQTVRDITCGTMFGDMIREKVHDTVEAYPEDGVTC